MKPKQTKKNKRKLPSKIKFCSDLYRLSTSTILDDGPYVRFEMLKNAFEFWVTKSEAKQIGEWFLKLSKALEE